MDDKKIELIESQITFEAGETSSIIGRLIRIIIFPFMWVLFGKAKL
ncbi:hypothetical protein H8D04_01350 [bacterium]|nr:hypothetical protein [bacterium]